MRCLSCQYDLSQLTDHRCPECGRAFDPNNPSTFEYEGKQPRSMFKGDRRARATIGIGLGACLIILAFGGLLLGDLSLGGCAVYSLVGIGGVALFYLLLMKASK